MNPPSIRQTLLGLLAPAIITLALLPSGVQAAGGTTGSGKSATETRAVADFQAITLQGSMDLQVRQGSTQQVQVSADDNLLPLLETEVQGSGDNATLVVRWKKSGWGTYINTRSKVLVNVVLPRLSALKAEGSGDIQLDSFNTPALKLSLSGSGDAKLNQLTTGELVIGISGSGDVAGSGSAARLKVSIAGSGDVRLRDMKSDDVSISIAGSGDAAVNAEKTLEVTIAGSGDVSYSGNPALKSRVAGSGSVNRR